MNSSSSSPSMKLTPPALLALICRALDEKKAADLRVLEVSAQSSITDFLVLATGTSEPHLRALRVELEKTLDAAGTKILGMDRGLESGWLVVDAFDVMIHVFTPENRKRYALENLWKDAEEISVPALLNPEAAPAAKKKQKPSKAAKKPKVPAKKAASKPAKKSAKKKS
jgi:ribosome-associated protein